MEEKELKELAITSKIISHLRKDSRTSFVAISQDVKIPLSTIYDQIKRLHQDTVIRRFTSLVDFSKLGYHYQARIAMMVHKPERNDLLAFLSQHPSVNSLHRINSGFDFLIETVHKDVKEHTQFMEELKEKFTIINLHEYQVLEEIEKEKFLRNQG